MEEADIPPDRFAYQNANYYPLTPLSMGQPFGNDLWTGNVPLDTRPSSDSSYNGLSPQSFNDSSSLAPASSSSSSTPPVDISLVAPPTGEVLHEWFNELLYSICFSANEKAAENARQSLQTAVFLYNVDPHRLLTAPPGVASLDVQSAVDALPNPYSIPSQPQDDALLSSTANDAYQPNPYLPNLGNPPPEMTPSNFVSPVKCSATALVPEQPLDNLQMMGYTYAPSFENDYPQDRSPFDFHQPQVEDNYDQDKPPLHFSQPPPLDNFVNGLDTGYIPPLPHTTPMPHAAPSYWAPNAFASGSSYTLDDAFTSTPIYETNARSSPPLPPAQPQSKRKRSETKRTQKAPSSSKLLPKGVANIITSSGQSHPVDGQSTGTKTGQRSSVPESHGDSGLGPHRTKKPTAKKAYRATPGSAFIAHELSYGGLNYDGPAPRARQKQTNSEGR